MRNSGRSKQSLTVALTFSLVIWAAGLVHPQAADPSWNATGDLITGRSGHTATLLPDGKVLVAGGGPPGGPDSAELYDPATGTWSSTGNLMTRRSWHTAMLLPNGTVLVMGGLSAADIRAIVTTVELYDPAIGTWSAIGNLRADGSATLLPDSKVLIAGSHTADPIASSAAQVYDVMTGTVNDTGSLSIGRSLHTATLLPTGHVLVAGGHIHPVEAGLASGELYDPVSGSWSSSGTLNTGRFEHSATLLANGGQVLVVGGWVSGFTRLDSAEIYDLASGTWSSTGSLNAARTGHTATLLSDGKVLIVGGGLGPPANTPPLSSAEVYDPDSGTWSITASLGTGRAGHSATLLPDGKVLVAGGSGGIRTCELYDPGTGPASMAERRLR